MASSGQLTFSFDIADTIETAYERCGLEVRAGHDAKTARTALNLLFTEWVNDQVPLWKVTRREIPLVAGQSKYYFMDGEVDVVNLAIRTNGSSNSDIVIERQNRLGNMYIPDKARQGRPTQFFVDRQIRPYIEFWPVPDTTTRSALVDFVSHIEAVTSSMRDANVPQRFYAAMVDGLAYYIARTRPKLVSNARRQELYQEYQQSYRLAKSADEDTESFQVRPYTRKIR
jgi:hypothetical protein